MASFYKEGKITLSPSLHITISKPCLALLKRNTLYLSDPAHTGGKVEGAFNNQAFFTELPSDGTTILINLSSKNR
jgi:hypothetical protein